MRPCDSSGNETRNRLENEKTLNRNSQEFLVTSEGVAFMRVLAVGIEILGW